MIGSVWITTKCWLRSSVAAWLAWAPLHAAADARVVGNEHIARRLSWEDDSLGTERVTNLLGKQETVSAGGDEFALTLRLDGAKESVRLTSADFKVTGNQTAEGGGQFDIRLVGKAVPLELTLRYTAKPGEAWMRKQLALTARKPVRIEKVELEHLTGGEAYAPYQADQMTAKGGGEWRPPLGQPCYMRTGGTWWGTEFPAARNEVKDGTLICSYLAAVEVKAGETWLSHAAVCGAADDPEFVKDAFFEYIDATRARPLRLQTQYNSWFDYGSGVDAEKFAASVRKVDEELVLDRGVPPLRAYVIDDGWQDGAKDWSKGGVWPVNAKFDRDFGGSRAAVRKAKSELGLWLSPGCLFGGQKAIPKMRAAGWRALDPWMSMTGDAYMDALEKRMVGLTKDGTSYFKLDGVFGHLNTRNFDIPGFKGGEADLNHARYDEAKERYLALGSERLMKIFKRMGDANPQVYIVISNGAFLSPWWLQHADAVWMINAGDAADGADRTGELVNRDRVYYRLAVTDNTQFPLHSIFNHEPKKTESGEEPEIFRRYLFMNLSRGTGFVELYLKTFKLAESDWDVLAEGMRWVHKVFPAFRRARMIGGDPGKNEVYGYSGWTENTGYVSLHNPSQETREFRFTLNRKLGLPAALAGSSYEVSSPLKGDTVGLAKVAKGGEEVVVSLPPRAIRILEFAAGAKADRED